MTEARLVTTDKAIEALAAALRRLLGPDPPGWLVKDEERAAIYWHHKAESLYAQLPLLVPAAAPAEGLREALTILLVDAERVPVPIGHEWMDDYRNLQRSLERARAALARHESAGSE